MMKQANRPAVRYGSLMLVPPRECWWLAALLVGCSAQDSNDAGRDTAWVYDASYDVQRRETSAGDAADVAPSVDVIVFDVAAMDASADAPTAVPDSGGAQCSAIAEQYARTVREAQACTQSSDCATIVCETICCNCQVYVSGTPEQLANLATLQSRWTALNCEEISPCMRYVCGAPLATECTSAGRCATVRRGD
jgi:hypothetical protein